eukprot:2618731-Alexandrium_andersonii.AAC.1
MQNEVPGSSGFSERPKQTELSKPSTCGSKRGPRPGPLRATGNEQHRGHIRRRRAASRRRRGICEMKGQSLALPWA